MPGIVGFITKMPREQAEPQLLRMVESIRHESCYRTGTWIDESLGVYLGWAARSGSFSDGMPLCNERGDVVLVFSGEEFPEPGTARRLKEKGHSAEGASYLVHLYEEDPTFPAGLNGRFHGLIADRTRGTAMLFNDRYGMHRIYYHESHSRPSISPQKPRQSSRSVQNCAELDHRALGEFVSCGCVLENRTLFKGIQVLPPASAWIFRGGCCSNRKALYFEPEEWENQDPLRHQKAYYQKLREVFSANLPRYFNGREPIGMSLTGGLDSRMIMAWHKASPASLPCYSFGGMFRDSQDVRLRVEWQVCKQPHEVIPVGTISCRTFPSMRSALSTSPMGASDLSHSPDLYVNERAQRSLPSA